MAKLGVKGIQEVAKQLLAAQPGGMRGSALIRQIAALHPETNQNTIYSTVWRLDKLCGSDVHKPSPGLFINVAGSGSDAAVIPANPTAIMTVLGSEEKAYYRPFAEWLVNDLGEATVARPLGGAGLREKWGTPDVVGVYKPQPSHRIQFAKEIIAVEIKVDGSQPVVAFGQAVAYRLFAAKSYVVMPGSISDVDHDRLEALCMLYGIGLVLFKLDPACPDFSIRVRAQRFLPDMFYVNEFADRLCKLDQDSYNQLFV